MKKIRTREFMSAILLAYFVLSFAYLAMNSDIGITGRAVDEMTCFGLNESQCSYLEVCNFVNERCIVVEENCNDLIDNDNDSKIDCEDEWDCADSSYCGLNETVEYVNESSENITDNQSYDNVTEINETINTTLNESYIAVNETINTTLINITINESIDNLTEIINDTLANEYEINESINITSTNETNTTQPSSNISLMQGYDNNTNSSLTIWDVTDNNIRYVNETIGFYANYTNLTDAIENASCIIIFNETPENMTWNNDSRLYEYNKTFNESGIFEYNVSCNASGYAMLKANDTSRTYDDNHYAILSTNDIRSIFADSGKIYLGTEDKGIIVVEDDSVSTVYNKTNGLLSDNISAITRGSLIYGSDLGAGIISFEDNISTNLEIWDDTDNIVKYVNENIRFYANYSSNESAIENASCLISFNDSSGDMTYNNTINLYIYNRSFSDPGNYSWNVTCNKTGFDNPIISDIAVINDIIDSVPNVTLHHPEDNKVIIDNVPVTVEFNCSAEDDNQISKISLYLTNSSNESFKSNQTIFSNKGRFDIDKEEDFDKGDYENISYTSDYIKIDNLKQKGKYYSELFNPGLVTTWNNISFTLLNGWEIPRVKLGEKDENIINELNTTGLKLYFDLNDNIEDYSLSNISGINNISLDDTIGKLSGAYTFGLAHSRIDINPTTKLSNPHITYSLWAKIENISEQIEERVLLDKKATFDHAIKMDIPVNQSKMRFSVKLKTSPTTVRDVYSNNNVTEGWHHYVGSYDGDKLRLYIDGTLQSDIDNTNGVVDTTATGNSLRFGEGNPGGQFYGDIDEVSVWNRSLSSQEVLDLYRRGITRMNLSVMVCNISSCLGETWKNLGIVDSTTKLNYSAHYLNFKLHLESDTDHHQRVYNITIDSDGFSTLDNQQVTFVNDMYDGNYTWSCAAYDNNEQEASGENYSLIINHNESLTLNSPISNITFNKTSEITSIQFNNVTAAEGYYIYYSDNLSYIENIDESSVPNIILTGINNNSWQDFEKETRYFRVAAYSGSSVNISDTILVRFRKRLYSGLNLISIPINLTYSNLTTITETTDPLNDIPESIEHIYLYDNNFTKIKKFENTYYPSYQLDVRKGYFVQAGDSNLTLVGKKLDEVNISLSEGFNLIGWPSLDIRSLGNESIDNPIDVSVPGCVESIYSLEEDFRKSDYFENYGYHSNDNFTMIMPGEGYWIKSKTCELMIN